MERSSDVFILMQNLEWELEMNTFVMMLRLYRVVSFRERNK